VKRMIFALLGLSFVILALSGCVGRYPAYNFAPYTMSDGEQGFKLVLVNYPENTKPDDYLPFEIARYKICPKGWAITNKEHTKSGKDDVVVYNGRCKLN